MRFSLLFVLINFISIGYAQSQATTYSQDQKAIEQRLFDLPGVAFELVSKPCTYPLRYKLSIKQAVDHTNSDGPTFFHRVYLTHRGFDKNVVMQTQGYEVRDRVSEIEEVLDANSLNIEHRYFGESKPSADDWQYLTLEQATADLHHINRLFRMVYPTSQWISSGISKGGQTTIFYKYFYPEDVDVSIPYVAPFNYALEDKRIYDFLNHVGTEACRKDIYDVQVALLKQEKEALQRIEWYAKGANLTFDYLDGSLAKAYEFAVLEYPFSFWQWGSQCDEIPDPSVGIDSLMNYLLSVSNVDFLADKSMKEYAPHYYQAVTQMGYYGYDIAPFKGLLTQFNQNPSAAFYPLDAKNVKFDNTLNTKAGQWLSEKGNNMLYIYGALDTWTSQQVVPSPKVNSKSYVLPEAHHGTARIKNMDKEMKEDFMAKVAEMLK